MACSTARHVSIARLEIKRKSPRLPQTLIHYHKLKDFSGLAVGDLDQSLFTDGHSCPRLTIGVHRA